MTPIEQINWDKQVKSGEMSFGALKAELAATRERLATAELAWESGKVSLAAAVKDICKAKESEAWWRTRSEVLSDSLNRALDKRDENARQRDELASQLEASQAALAEQLAARAKDAEEIARLVTVLAKDAEEITWLKNRMTAIDSQRFKMVKRVIAGGEEVARLKKRVNSLIRKAKQ